jgi:hypothetical protein
MKYIKKYNESIDSLVSEISYDEFLKKIHEFNLLKFTDNEIGRIISELSSSNELIKHDQISVKYWTTNTVTDEYPCLSIKDSIIGDLYIHKTSDLYFYVEVGGFLPEFLASEGGHVSADRRNRKDSDINSNFLNYYVIDTIEGFKNLVNIYIK